jgi:hypothetical protein
VSSDEVLVFRRSSLLIYSYAVSLLFGKLSLVEWRGIADLLTMQLGIHENLIVAEGLRQIYGEGILAV